MTRIRLYLDEDAMQHGLVTALRARRVDTLTASDAGMINKGDGDHLRWAARDQRALYSFNMADYTLLHRQWLARETRIAESFSPPSNAIPSANNCGDCCAC